jgi:aspartate/methionine/tyrosine aminotransferase
MLKLAASLSRLGTESAFEILARAQALAAQGKDIINLGIGQPDFKTPKHIVEAGIQALRDGHHGYTPANGLPQVREAVAADLQRRHGAKVDPDCVVIVPGGKPTMFFAILMFGEPGAEIMYPNPGFPIYKSLIKYSGATPVPIALSEDKDFAFDADTVLSQITPATRLIIINSPANPTGGVTPKAEIDKLVAGLAKHPDVAILSDEIYSQMLYGGREHVSLLNYPEIRDRLIMLDGWSKTYAMTGWRRGWAIAIKPLVDAMGNVQGQQTSCPSSVSQYALLAAMDGPQECVEEMRKQFEIRRNLVYDRLGKIPGLKFAKTEGAFYVFFDVTAYFGKTISGVKITDSMTFTKVCLENAHVNLVPGSAFGSEGFARMSYASSNQELEEGTAALAALLATAV